MQQREEKRKIIDELAGVFQNPVSVLVVNYRGLDVKSMQSVRKQVKETGAELRVVKNTFLHKACEGTDVERIKELFQGPTAIAICGQESPATAKVFVQARKEFEKLVLIGGLVDGKVCGVQEIEQIAKLPSKHVLISMFASALVFPLSNFVGAVDQMRSKIVYALEALKETKDGRKVAGTDTQSMRNDDIKAGVLENKTPSPGKAEKTAEESSDDQNKKEENKNG